VDFEIRRALERVRSANDNFRREATEDNRELVCVETRAAYGILQDVFRWAKCVDEDARQQMENAIQDAVDLVKDNPDKVYEAICQRLALVRGLTTAQVQQELAIHT
jgi:hypothetical protein